MRPALIKDWYHVAIVELSKLKGFIAQPAAIAKSLKSRISPLQAELALDRLERLGFFLNKAGKPPKRDPIILESKVQSRAIREHHVQNLNETVREITHGKMEDRYLNATTIAIRKSDYQQILELHDAFRRKLHGIACDQDGEEVVRIQTQILKLT